MRWYGGSVMAVSRFGASTCVRLSVYGLADPIIIMIATMVAARCCGKSTSKLVDSRHHHHPTSPTYPCSHGKIRMQKHATKSATHAAAAHINFHFILESALFSLPRGAEHGALVHLHRHRVQYTIVEMRTFRAFSRGTSSGSSRTDRWLFCIYWRAIGCN